MFADRLFCAGKGLEEFEKDKIEKAYSSQLLKAKKKNVDSPRQFGNYTLKVITSQFSELDTSPGAREKYGGGWLVQVIKMHLRKTQGAFSTTELSLIESPQS